MDVTKGNLSSSRPKQKQQQQPQQRMHNKKLLENLGTLHKYIEESQQDLYCVCETLLEAYKTEFQKVESLEEVISKLKAQNAKLNETCSKLEHDLSQIRERYQKIWELNDELKQNIGFANCKRQTNNNDKLRSLDDRNDPIDSEREIAPASPKVIDPISEECATANSPELRLSDSPSLPPNRSNNQRSKSLSAIEQQKNTRNSSVSVASNGDCRLRLSIASRRRLKLTNPRANSATTTTLLASLKTDFATSELRESKHDFVETRIARFHNCPICKSGAMPLVKLYACVNCQLTIDARCYAENAPVAGVPCVASTGVTLGDLLAMNDDKSFPPSQGVPALLSKCCEQIERRGLNDENLYKKCVDNSKANQIFGKFLIAKKVDGLALDKIDVNLLGALVVKILASLREPLIGVEKWYDFVRACDQELPDERGELLRQLIWQLPKPNRHTLAFLLLHLKRVEARSLQNQVDGEAIAVTFGQLIANKHHNHYQSGQRRSSNGSVQVISSRDQMKLAQLQHQIVLALLDLPDEYYQEALNDDSNGNSTISMVACSKIVNYEQVMMNDRQRKSFFEKVSSSMY